MCSWKGQNHGTLEQKIWASFQVVPQMKRMFKVISDSQIPPQTFSDILNLNHKTKTNTLKTQRLTSIFVLENEHLAHFLSSPSSSTSGLWLFSAHSPLSPPPPASESNENILISEHCSTQRISYLHMITSRAPSRELGPLHQKQNLSDLQALQKLANNLLVFRSW